MTRFYIGTYTNLGGPGVAVCEREGDELRLLSADDSVANPTYCILSEDGNALYASAEDRETGEGCAASWRVEGERLRFLGRSLAGGRDSCHLTLSPNGRFLYMANYEDGSVSAFHVQRGAIGERIQLVRHEGSGPDRERQEHAHAHQTVFRPGTNELFAVDLGMDAVVAYNADPDTGLLTRAARIEGARPGYGPRHLLFSGADAFYLAYEMGSAVSLYRREAESWVCAQTLSTLPEDYMGFNAVAAIRLREGRLYVSNRGHDSIAVFAIGSDGTMRREAIVPASGRFPRDFDLDGDGALITANQNGGGVTLSRGAEVLFRLDVPGAVCVCVDRA